MFNPFEIPYTHGMNPTHVAAFKAVAEAGGFTRGADVLLVSQSAVSKQVAELESSLGVRLFDRIGRRVALTEAGDVLLQYARRMGELSLAAQTALADLSAMRRGRIRIGVTPTIGAYLLPRTLVYFRQRFPDVAISVVVHPSSVLLSRLADAAVDFVMTASRPIASDVTVTEFMNDTFPAVCRADHPAAALGKLSLDALSRQCVVLRDLPGRSVGWVERMLNARGCVPRNALRLPQTESIKQAVLAGLGIAFLPRIAVADDLAAGRLVRLTVPSFVLERPYYWAEPAAARSKAVQAFWCVLKHAVRGTLPAKVRIPGGSKVLRTVRMA